MRLSFWFSGSVVVAALVACTTDYQKGLDDPQYAGPNALADQSPPGASIDEKPSGTSSGGPAVGAVKCGTPIEAGACAIKYSTDIFPIFAKAACSSTSCHGNGNPAPLINKDPDATYQALANFTSSTSKVYINPCSIDPTQSSFSQNIDPTATDRGTLMPPSVGLTDGTDLSNIKAWVACGAPKN